MQWLNEPAKWTACQDRLSATAVGETDFWRRTHDNGIRDNGHFCFDTVTGNFSVSVKLSASYASQYDQAGLMVRADERTWLKCGVEFTDGRQHASSVVTRDWSDWSLMPLNDPALIWMQCQRNLDTFTVRCSLDGVRFNTIRQAFLTEQQALQVGMMLAAPKGDGFEVLFEDFLLTTS